KPQRTRRTAAEIADTRDCQALGYEDVIPGRLANAAQLLPISSNRKLMALILRDLCGLPPRPLRFKIFLAVFAHPSKNSQKLHTTSSPTAND
ncbi:MAG: hypothetical protein DMG82_13395, partial [Acidobacteria bacterium]